MPGDVLSTVAIADLDGMIDADELMEAMNRLGAAIIEREAKEMIDFADQDKGIRSMICTST